MYVFGAECVVVPVIFGREAVAVQRYAGLGSPASAVGYGHPAMTARPPRHAYAQSLDGHHPNARNQVLFVISVFAVDALTVEQSHLIVDQRTPGTVGQDVALHLNTDVTACRRLLASTVAEACQLLDDVGQVEEAL